MKRLFKILKIIGLLVWVSLITLLLFQYIQCNIYNFSDTSAFSGDSIYNPYNRLGAKWIKANFHAHSSAWGKITNGKSSPNEVVSIYKSMGYNLACLSNYHKPFYSNDTNCAIPIYEHGYNIKKSHFLCIGCQEASFFDTPYSFLISQNQSIIHHLAGRCRILALAHPQLRNAFTTDNIRLLDGYTHIEVYNTHKNSEKLWDAALSAGRAVWLLGNDDTHNAFDSLKTGVIWNMIQSDNHPDSVFDALLKGASYAVQGSRDRNENMLRSLICKNCEVHLELEQKANSIIFIGNNGKEKFRLKNTSSATYTFKPNDSYIRIVVQNPNSSMYFNPLIRYDGQKIPTNPITASVNPLKTSVYRLIILIFWVIVVRFSTGRTIQRLLRNRRYQVIIRWPLVIKRNPTF